MEMAFDNPPVSYPSPCSSTISLSSSSVVDRAPLALWAYMPCEKDQPGSRIKRFVLARDEVLHNQFTLHQEKPERNPFDRGVLVLVHIDADTPEEKRRGAVRQKAYDRLDAAIQREKKKMDIMDGVDRFPRRMSLEDDRASI